MVTYLVIEKLSSIGCDVLMTNNIDVFSSKEKALSFMRQRALEILSTSDKKANVEIYDDNIDDDDEYCPIIISLVFDEDTNEYIELQMIRKEVKE